MNKLLLILLFAGFTYAQADLPDVGTLADIKGKSKVYIVADNFNLKKMVKEFDKQKTLLRVDKPDDAEFFIEYKELTRTPPTELGLVTITGQVDVYILRDKRKVIAWSDSKAATMDYPSVHLLKRFFRFVEKDPT